MRILLNNIKECFNKILKKSEFGKTSICIIVSLDVDGVCALRIFTALLNRENLQFRIMPVAGFSEMHDAINTCGSTYRNVIFINCGNIYDMKEFCPEGVNFYIFDNHQPMNHNNVNCKKQIYVIDDSMNQIEHCPGDDYQEISDDDLDLDEESSVSSHSSRLGESNSEKRMEIQRKQQQKLRKQARKYKQEVNQQHDEYYNAGHYYSRPTATVVYTMAQQLNHDCNDLLWYAVLGLTDAYIHLRLNQKNYDIVFNELQNEVLRLNLQYENTQQQVNPEEIVIENSNKKVGVIFIESEYKFLLLRQSSLFNAMYYSSYVGTKLNLWKDKDNHNRLQEFIVRLGIPLNEARQDYKYMKQQYKVLLRSKVAEVASKFQMDDILYRSFVRQLDSKLQISATDMVNAITALLEFPPLLLTKYLEQYQSSEVVMKLKAEDNSSRSQNFWCAFDSLDSKQTDLFDQGASMAIEFQEALVNEAMHLIEKKEIFPSKHFRYAILKNQSVQQKKFFQHPQSLQKLALLIMDIYREQGYKQINKSVILANQILDGQTYLVVGVVGGMSFGSQEKNLFGNFFLKVVNEQQFQYKQDSFETSVIEIHKEDFNSFIDAIMDYKK